MPIINFTYKLKELLEKLNKEFPPPIKYSNCITYTDKTNVGIALGIHLSKDEIKIQSFLLMILMN